MHEISAEDTRALGYPKTKFHQVITIKTMSYRWKDTFITIMPGMTLLGLLYTMAHIGGCEKCTPYVAQLLQSFQLSSFFDTFLLTALAIYVGYMVNVFASYIEGKTGLKEKGLSKEERHHLMNDTAPSKKIEEYFVHYAMARNMAFVHLLCIPLLFLCTCLCCCNVLAWLMLGYLILSTFLLYNAYRRHLKRYVEIIVAEHDYQQRHNLSLNAEL